MSNTEVLGVLQPGEHGSTFGGNPVACAVARAALRVIIDEGMVENSAAMGALLLEGLAGIKSPVIKEVRGRGLMCAVELHPDAGGARAILRKADRQGALVQGDPREHHPAGAPLWSSPRMRWAWALERFSSVFPA